MKEKKILVFKEKIHLKVSASKIGLSRLHKKKWFTNYNCRAHIGHYWLYEVRQRGRKESKLAWMSDANVYRQASTNFYRSQHQYLQRKGRELIKENYDPVPKEEPFWRKYFK